MLLSKRTQQAKKKMDDQDLTRYIEDYMNDVLSADKRIEFEHRLETDKAFQQEVRLHKLLKGHLSDPGRWKHYDALATVSKDPFPPGDETLTNQSLKLKHRGWKWLGLIASLMVVGVFVWQFNKPTDELPSQPPVEKQPTQLPVPPPIKGSEPVQQGTPSKPKPPGQKLPANIPIAEADPANFEPNASMEVFVNGGLKSEGLNLKITRPLNGTEFTPDKNGTTTVRFTGTIGDAPKNEPTAFVLLIFNNHDINKPLNTIPLLLQKDASGKSFFDLRQPLNLRQGLYYFTIEQEGRMAYTGKFMIGKVKR